MACGAAAVGHRQVGDSVWHYSPAELALDQLFCEPPATREIHWRQGLSVGQLSESLTRTADGDKAFDPVVIRVQLLIADRPILPVSVVAGRFELLLPGPAPFPWPTGSLPV